MTDLDSTPMPPGARGVWRSRWRSIAGFWIVQAIVIHLVVCTFFSNDPGLSFRFLDDALIDAELLLLDSGFAAVITASQAVLLLPVRRPRLSTHPPGLRYLHGAIGGFAIAGVVWLALWPILLLLDWVGLDDAPADLMRTHFSWVLPLAIWVIATVLLGAAGRDGLPVLISVMLCALAAAMLFAGILGAAWSIPRLFVRNDALIEWTIGSMCGAILVAWAIATPLVWRFVRSRGADDGLSRLASRLLLGTMIEAACVIPLDVMVRRKTNCHCEEGTYWALAACWSVGLFACGPVIFLVPLSRRRRRWHAGQCDACGYDMNGCMTAERCPECGAGWRPAPAADDADSSAGTPRG